MDAPNERRAASRQSLGRLESGLGAALPPSTLAGFALAVLAVIAISLFSFRALSTRAESARRVASTLESVHSLLKDAETGQRGYLLTGEDAYLEPYRVAVDALPPQLARARQAIIDDPAQSRRLTSVELLVKDKLGELERTIELRRSGRSTEALSLVRADLGRQLMQKIRRMVDELLSRSALSLPRGTPSGRGARASRPP